MVVGKWRGPAIDVDLHGFSQTLELQSIEVLGFSDAGMNDSPPAPFTSEEKPRPVLVTSKKNNAVSANGKPRTREISSRYKSGITSTPRSPSPNSTETTAMSKPYVPKRSQSAERRRPSTPSSPSSQRSVHSSLPSTPLSKSSRPTSTPLSKSSRPSSPSLKPLSKSSRPSSPSSTPSSKSSRPSSPSSAPSSKSSRPSSPSSTPLSKSSRPLSPASRPSLSSLSSRPTTPVHDSMVERLNSARRSLTGRAPDGLWPSIRSLSASFQSDSSIILASKSERPVRNPSPDQTTKSSSNAVSERKRTPLRGRNASDQSENSRPVDNSHVRSIEQLRWPSMIGGKVSSNALSTRSMDLADKNCRSASLPISARGFSPARGMSLTDAAGRGLKNSTNEVARPVSSKGSEKTAHFISSARNVTSLPSHKAPSSTRPGRSPSPVPGLVRPSSPNKASTTLSSVSRGMLSPSRTRPSTPGLSSNTSTRIGVSSSILNYMEDVRKGKRSPSHIEDAHQLRLLYNRDLQWRFVNARAESASSTQKIIAEDMLCNVWNISVELLDSVITKRIAVQNVRQDMKLKLILREQIAYLEDWSELDVEHSSCLSGVIEALKASTVRLPVTGGARADIHAVKNAISSAVDVMQAMGSSICHLLSRVEGTNSLVSELSEVAVSESILLDECRELLASTAAMQVQECSIRTHLLQLGPDAQVEQLNI